MKILIMVLSYNESPYKELMQAQQQSWDSVEVEGVRTVYYYGSACPGDFDMLMDNGELKLQCGDKYFYMAEKLKLALRTVKDWDYDIIFRTNSSSYVNKQRLKEFAETLPKEKLYAGWTFVDSEDFGGLCVSGAGIFLSRDTAEILREQIDPSVEMEEDVYASRILRKNGIVAIDDKSRIDYPQDLMKKNLSEAYHIRFKGENGDRENDRLNMLLVHNLIKINEPSL